ncbi:MAG: tRNA preQ1(34) S-adenosylmethionine ribosyltransferase-isomerase QueA [Nitrospira bacterium HGW-Nitrospira-1]|nr:MAG: tRNA preQ1(34) S-adenosylmethionine ribosyltransferase-isomerase QueA [Nitrospira bacterium HGW-Nitrospira-1]
MKTADYDFPLPEEAIAYNPATRRDNSRLMVLHRDGALEHKRFHDLPLFIDSGDLLLLNNSKVFPARLYGYKPDGERLEILLVSEISEGLWNIMIKGRYTGDVTIAKGITARISGGKTALFGKTVDVRKLLWESGHMPLPPYIKRPADETDRERYQTVYASVEGSIAAPTAGLHFTGELLRTIASKGVSVRFVTLHVGIGTFRPVKTPDIESHRMDEEFFQMDPSLLSEIAHTRRSGNRVIAVGTTVTRTIEGYLNNACAVFSSNGTIKGSTNIFIYEGYSFKAIDALITNFHLPVSTPLMLASAFAGRENLLNAYRSALSEKYRFFSYGDAMLVL